MRVRGTLRPGCLRGRLQALTTATLKGNAVLGRYRNVVWLIGDGRSGTTWIQELLCWSRRYRMMYEPFHPTSGPAAEIFTPNLFVHPNDRDPQKLAMAADVFAGRYFHPNVDRDNRRMLYHGVVIKDIFAHLFAAWVITNFSHVKPVLIVRNPFEVALSKCRRQDWVWMTDARDFLHQRHLVDDCLEPFVELILESEKDFIHQQVLIWSIIHFVLFRHIDARRVHLLRYEDVVEDPIGEIQRLQEFVSYTGELPPRPIDRRRLELPSRGSEGRAQAASADTRDWAERLSTKQIDAGVRVLDRFGLVAFASLDNGPQ